MVDANHKPATLRHVARNWQMDSGSNVTLHLRRNLGHLRAIGILKILHRYHQSGATQIAATLLAHQVRRIQGHNYVAPSAPVLRRASPRGQLGADPSRGDADDRTRVDDASACQQRIISTSCERLVVPRRKVADSACSACGRRTMPATLSNFPQRLSTLGVTLTISPEGI